MKRKPQQPKPSPLALLEQIKAYREFDSVKISPDGSVEVKYAAPTSERPKAKPVKERLTAIESLSRKPPDFDFEVQ